MTGRQRRAHTALQRALALLPLLLLWPPLRHGLESRMSLHMLVEFPALFAAGWAARQWAWPSLARHRRLHRLARGAAALDWRGWTSACLASSVALVWMIPSVLDASLLSGPVAALKFASWPAAGALLAARWRRMDPELLLFVLGNQAWMAATAGLLFLDAPSALCVNYLSDDQRHAGTGLVLLACGLGMLAVRLALRPAAVAEACNITAAPHSARG